MSDDDSVLRTMLANAIDLIEELVMQGCRQTDDGSYDTGAIGVYKDAMYALVSAERWEWTCVGVGRRAFARPKPGSSFHANLSTINALVRRAESAREQGK